MKLKSLLITCITLWLIQTSGNSQELWTWGSNQYGQIGNGTKTAQAVANPPAQITPTMNWRKISCGYRHTCAIKTDGTLWAWGYNADNQLGNGNSLDQIAPIQIGTSTDWKEISCGGTYTLALKTDGTLWAWGTNDNGQLGNGTTTKETIPIKIGIDTDWQKISCGYDHSLAIKNDGTLWAWGDNDNGQLGNGTTTKQTAPIQIGTDSYWKEIGSGFFHTLAIKSDGSLWTWGMNSYYQLGDNSSTSKSVPTQIGTNTNWSKIDGGYLFSIGIQTDGTLWSWGYDGSGGSLGNNASSSYVKIPSQVDTNTDWKEISCGDSHTIAQKTDNTIWAWGLNTNGQLGDGNTSSQKTPVQVSTKTSCITAVAGGLFSMALYKKEQIITFSLSQQTYGDNDVTLSATGGNSGNAIVFSSSDETVAKCTGTHGETLQITGAGFCTITATQEGNDTYMKASKSEDLTVSKASLTAKADDKTKIFETENPEFTVTYTGFVNNEDETFLDTKAQITCNATQTSFVGDYDIVVSGVNDANYDVINYTKGTLSITKADPIITWHQPTSITYGTVLSDTQLNATSYTDGTFAYTPNFGTILNAGTNHTLKVSFTPNDVVNYNIIKDSVNLDVEKASLVITANDTTKVYGTENPKFEVTYTGFVNNEDASVIDTKANITCAATTTSDAGQYDINVGNAEDNNYEMSYVNGKLTIGKAPLVVTANDTTKVYGTENPQFEVTYMGFVNNEDANVIDTKANITCAATTVSDAGQYDITVENAEDNNYEMSYVNGKLTIGKAPLVITANDTTKVYGTENPQFEVTYTGFVNNEDANVIDTKANITCAATTTSDAGQYDINVQNAEDNNYEMSYVNGKLTIGKAPLVVTANDTTKVYGTENPTFDVTYTGFVNNEDVNVIDTKAVAKTLATAISDAGHYDIIAENGADNNYEMSYVNGKLTIGKAPLVVTANDTTKVYGTENPTFDVTYAGFVNNEDETVLDQKAVITCHATETSSVGHYDILVSGATDVNYEVTTYTKGTLSITKANPIITWNNPDEITYGTALSATQLNATTNVAGTIVYTPAMNTILNAGTAQTLETSFTPDDMVNYNSKSHTITLDVSKAPLTITANDTTKVYGTENPTFDITYTGFVNNEDVNVIDNKATATTVATATSDAGQYDIIAENGTDNNYEMNYVNGHLTVSKAPLTVTANDTTKVYGTENPTFELTYAGFVNNEDVNVIDTKAVAKTLATVTSDAGQYDIIADNGDDNNYDMSYVNGHLTVSKAPLTVTANDTTKVYGTENPTFDVTYAGFVNNEDVNVINTKAVAKTLATVTSDAGQYDIIAENGTDNNYEMNYVNGHFIITQATPILTWETPASITIGKALSENQLNATANIEGQFLYTPEAGTFLAVGDAQALIVEFTPTDIKNYRTVQDTVYIDVKMITGITNMNEINIRLYPNPVTSGFYIQGLEDQTSSIELFDLSGKKLLQQNISNNEQVAIENLPAGTYIVRINTQNKTSHIKLIKQ